jgi:hypothetical protein
MVSLVANARDPALRAAAALALGTDFFTVYTFCVLLSSPLVK